jgi:UDP-2,3-diacylglucosamine pyrophosphatase LpxH
MLSRRGLRRVDTMSRTRRASSVFVISDLHLGGQAPAMMGRPGLLASFIDGLSARLGDAPGSALELVIAGDFVDFLAAAPSAGFTPDPRAACDKLGAVMKSGSPFAPVFDALGRHVAGGHRLTVLLGNHDVELALPQVQAAFLDRIVPDRSSRGS